MKGHRVKVLVYIIVAAVVCASPSSRGDASQGSNVTVLSGSGSVRTGVRSSPLKRLMALPDGATVSTEESAVALSMPDGTVFQVMERSAIRIIGFRFERDKKFFGVDVLWGQLWVRAFTRNSTGQPIEYRVITSINTVVAFRATEGLLAVDSSRDEVYCTLCAPAPRDIRVRASRKNAALTIPGQKATITLNGGLKVEHELAFEPPKGMGYGFLHYFGGSVVGHGAGYLSGNRSDNGWLADGLGLEVKPGGGDDASINACEGHPFLLTVVGGQPPYRIEPSDDTLVLNSRSAELSDGGAFNATARSTGDHTIVDAAGSTAKLQVHVTRYGPRCLSRAPTPSQR
jgi:hypothetical protein